ncbi:MAG TPA: hypothetical protein VN257_03325 [Actinotalea sp.]|nr:hypothetical protein [Actinotalea sp.]
MTTTQPQVGTFRNPYLRAPIVADGDDDSTGIEPPSDRLTTDEVPRGDDPAGGDPGDRAGAEFGLDHDDWDDDDQDGDDPDGDDRDEVGWADAWDDDWDDDWDDGDGADFDTVCLSPERPALLEDDDIVEHLCGVVGADRAGRPSLWVTFIDGECRPVPVVVAADEIPPVPDRHGVSVLLGKALLEAIELTTDLRAVVAVVRRGGGWPAPLEARWAGAVREAAAAYGLGVRAVVAIGEHRCTPLPG